MIVFTVYNPWAELIRDGSKWVENRHWPIKHRGPIGIHASKRRVSPEVRKARPDMVFGAIVATAELYACVSKDWLDESAQLCNRFAMIVLAHPHTEGPFCWILRDVQRLAKPIPCRGYQGLWRYDGLTHKASDRRSRFEGCAPPETERNLFS